MGTSGADTDREIVRGFALALDREDYAAAEAALAPSCVYLLRGERIEGAGAIVASYKGNGDAARAFDEIAYGSSVRDGDDGRVVIEFWDELVHRGRRHRHVCEQWVRVEGGAIVAIEHRDLAGEAEALAAFRAWCFGP
ncbi:MAG: hypothetical protein KC996_09680 [Phycisphaerales bacterium]|nr:hypothetical protein [Phycisphaerales bacterium]